MWANIIENEDNDWFKKLPENVQKIILDKPELLRHPSEHYSQQFIIRLLKEIQELKKI